MTATPESIQQRYATIERLYSEREWSQVEALSEALLLDLPDNPSDPLRQRVILLLGHTRLYGMGDVDSARGYYKALLRTEAEETLRQIADQGLEQCTSVARQQAEAPIEVPSDEPADEPALKQAPFGTPSTAEPAGASTGQAFPFGTPPTDTAATAAGAESAAMPWLQALGGGNDAMAVEVVEEPEQIEVALADPERRDDIELKEVERLPAGGSTRVEIELPHASQAAAAGLSPEEVAELSRGLLGVVLH